VRLRLPIKKDDYVGRDKEAKRNKLSKAVSLNKAVIGG